MANSRRLGVYSRRAIRLGVHPRSPRHRKSLTRHHTFRRLSGVGGGAANFRSAAARAKNHARLSAKAKAKAAAHTAFLRSPAHRAVLRKAALAAAMKRRAKQKLKPHSTKPVKHRKPSKHPKKLTARQVAARAALARKRALLRKQRKPHRKSVKKVRKRPVKAKPKPSPSGAPISASNYLNMF